MDPKNIFLVWLQTMLRIIGFRLDRGYIFPNVIIYIIILIIAFTDFENSQVNII